MASLVQLPNELSSDVLKYLWLQDLQNISLTCKHLRQVSHQPLTAHIDLKRRYWRLDDRITGNVARGPCGWLTPLVALLKGEIDPSYVEVANIKFASWKWHELPSVFGGKPTHKPYQDTDMDLVIKAAESSPWITDWDACGPRANAKDRPHFIREIYEGDQDNILAILIPLLPNLKRLSLPGGRDSNWLGSVTGVVARIVNAGVLAGGDEASGLPLSKLSYIGSGDTKSQGLDLDEIAPYLALPSVREVSLLGITQFDFEWSIELPQSNASEVVFAASAMHAETGLAFAKIFRGPCTIDYNPLIMQEQQGPPRRESWESLQVDGKGNVVVALGVSSITAEYLCRSEELNGQNHGPLRLNNIETVFREVRHRRERLACGLSPSYGQ